MKKIEKSDSLQMGYDTMLDTVAYESCVLVARKEQVYTADGKFMFSVAMTDRAIELLQEIELEQQKQYKLAADLAEFFNKATGNCDKKQNVWENTKPSDAAEFNQPQNTPSTAKKKPDMGDDFPDDLPY